MRKALKAVVIYLATNKKARAAEWALVVGIFEVIRASIGHP